MPGASSNLLLEAGIPEATDFSTVTGCSSESKTLIGTEADAAGICRSQSDTGDQWRGFAAEKCLPSPGGSNELRWWTYACRHGVGAVILVLFADVQILPWRYFQFYRQKKAINPPSTASSASCH